jgi:hypothetical protein
MKFGERLLLKKIAVEVWGMLTTYKRADEV